MVSPTFHARLGEVAAQVEAALDDLLALSLGPARLVEAMRYATLGGGKRLRPFLLIETARMFGVEGEGVLRAATALECVHVYSLIHDDLPAMDDDDLRRGKPTVHLAYDEATAILAGDALLTLAFQTMADERVHPDAALRCQLVTGLAQASGRVGMVGGQMLDLAAEGRYGAALHTQDSICTLQAMKTGALLTYAVEAGALLGRATHEEHERLRAYSHALGAAFQIADDCLDREADEATLGKRAAKDQDKGKATLVDMLGLEAARAEAERLTQAAIAAVKAFGPRADVLSETARFVTARQS